MRAFICAFCHPQGIDLKAGGRNKKKHRTAPKSENVYLKLLVKVRYQRRTPRLPFTGPATPTARIGRRCATDTCLLRMLLDLLLLPRSPGTDFPDLPLPTLSAPLYQQTVSPCCCAALLVPGAPHGQRLQQGGAEAAVPEQDTQGAHLALAARAVHGETGACCSATLRSLASWSPAGAPPTIHRLFLLAQLSQKYVIQQCEDGTSSALAASVGFAASCTAGSASELGWRPNWQHSIAEEVELRQTSCVTCTGSERVTPVLRRTARLRSRSAPSRTTSACSRCPRSGWRPCASRTRRAPAS